MGVGSGRRFETPPRYVAAVRGAVVLVVGLAVGCGYQLVRYDGRLGDVRSVAIPALVNDSFEPGVDAEVVEALRREFLRRGAVRLAEGPENADLVLTGRVRPIDVRSRSFTSVVLTLEYQVTLELDLTASLGDGTELTIDPRALRETERYLASADVEATRKNREEAIRRLAAILAERVHDDLAETLAP